MKSLRKYWSLLKISWETGLVYRVNILLWRFRQFLLTLMSLTLWTVIFGSADEVFSYTNAQMITYIFVASVAQSIILATALNGLARTVYTGELSNVLVKPVSVYLYLAAQDVADKLKNFGFIIFESLGCNRYPVRTLAYRGSSAEFSDYTAFWSDWLLESRYLGTEVFIFYDCQFHCRQSLSARHLA